MLDLADPRVNNQVDPLHDALAVLANKWRLLGVEHVLEHPGDQGVGHTQLQEGSDGPAGVGADGGVLVVVDGVSADHGQERVDGEDEAVKGRAVGDGLDLGHDGLVRHRGCSLKTLVTLGQRLTGLHETPGFLLLLGFKVDLAEEVLPCLVDGVRVLVVRGVVDEQTEVVISGLVSEIVEELDRKG